MQIWHRKVFSLRICRRIRRQRLTDANWRTRDSDPGLIQHDEIYGKESMIRRSLREEGLMESPLVASTGAAATPNLLHI